MILLDTDILGLFFAGHAQVTDRVRGCQDQIGTTIVTRIEILRGRFDFVLKAADGQQLMRARQLLIQSESDLAKLPVLQVTDPAAREFDKLRQQKKLKKIGRADLLIASIVLAHRATLVTRNVRHFRQVPGLMLQNWAE